MGRKTKETDPLGAVTLWDYHQEAGYLVRLTDANGDKITYGYDSEGRLTFETRGDPVQTGDGPGLPTWKTTYDEMGNRATIKELNGTVVTFHYDADKRLTTATTSTRTYKAFHDSNGQRVREARIAGGSTIDLDVVRSGQRVLEVFPKDRTIPIQRFVYGRGIDEVVLAEMDPSTTGTTNALYPLEDELGNVTHLTDQSGSVVERYQYEGYGKFRIFDPANSPRTVSSFGWNRLFQGREYLGIVDAYDFRARVLWPELGRFGQEDPLGTVDSANLYQGLRGSWTRFVDPFGLAAASDPDLPFILLRIQAAADEAARRHGVTDWDTMLKSGAKGDPIHLTFQELLMDPSSPYYHPRVVTEVDVGADGVVQLFGPRGARRRGALIKDTVILRPGLTSSSVVPRATRARDVVTLVVDLKIGKGARSRQTATFSRFGSPMVRLQPFNEAKGLFRRVAATGKTVRRLRALTPILRVVPSVAFLVGADMTLAEVRAALSRGDINRAAATLAGVDFLEDAVVDLGNLTEESVRDWLTRKGATGETRSRVLVEVDSQ